MLAVDPGTVSVTVAPASVARGTLDIRPATLADVHQFYAGALPAGTIRALAVVLGGDIQALMGIAYCGQSIQAFSELKPEVRTNRKVIAVAIRAMLRLLKSVKFPVVAVADESFPGSAALLRKCGFEHMCDSQQGEVYLWRSQSHS